MVPAVRSCSNQCYDFFIEPFNQGRYNLRDAFMGTKADALAHNILPGASTRHAEPLSLGERVSKAVIGVLLIIPIVGRVVMAILKEIDSEFLYLESSQTDSDPMGDNEGELAPPLSAAEMRTRKTEALNRLTQIEGMISANSNPVDALTHSGNGQSFQCSSAVLRFDLDPILRLYQTNANLTTLFDFRDWAAVQTDGTWESFELATRALGRYGSFDYRNPLAIFDTPGTRRGSIEQRKQNFENLRQNLFEAAIARYNSPGSTTEPNATVFSLLKNHLAYFKQQRDRVRAGTPAEEILKQQFRQFYRTIIDANRNCMDQMLSQMQVLALDVVATGITSQKVASQKKIFYRAGLALCKYRASLLKEILLRQNRHQDHMADLEREVTQAIAPMIGLNGRIFRAGAIIHVNANVQQVIDTFSDEYKPEEYLLRELRTEPKVEELGNDSHKTILSLREEMLAKINYHYDLENETPGAEPQPHHMDQRLSANFEKRSAGLGGDFTHAGIALVLETLGVIESHA